MASATAPVGSPPPLGARMVQNKEWFQWPPPLLRTAMGSVAMLCISSSSDLPSISVPATALLRLLT